MMQPWKEFLIKTAIVLGAIIVTMVLFVCVNVIINAVMLWQLGR